MPNNILKSQNIMNTYEIVHVSYLAHKNAASCLGVKIQVLDCRRHIVPAVQAAVTQNRYIAT